MSDVDVTQRGARLNPGEQTRVAGAGAAGPRQPKSEVMVSVQDVGKMYRMYNRPQDRLKEQLLWRFGKSYSREFWALRDVSFDVRRGEMVGIIGRNGSGKSTLLQIIAGTLTPTAGQVRVNGRLTALLELSSGFNHQFTGRDNVYLQGAILGFAREQMDALFDGIAAFADIGQFMDQPVKLYSSGMIVRLAFAINALLRPDILVIDEALSVGDIAFQRKCFNWLDELRAADATILLVSHSMGIIANLCNRAILLNKGRVHLEGEARAVVKEYHRLLFDAPTQSTHTQTKDWRRIVTMADSGLGAPLFDYQALRRALLEGTQSEPTVSNRAFVELPRLETGAVSTNEKRYGNGELTIQAVGLLDENSDAVNVVQTRQPLSVVLDVVVNQDVYDYGFGFVIEDKLGNAEFSVSTLEISSEYLPVLRAGQRLQIAFTFTSLLLQGQYFLSCGAWRVEGGQWYYYDRRVDVLRFDVHAKRKDVWGVADFGAQIGLAFLSD